MSLALVLLARHRYIAPGGFGARPWRIVLPDRTLLQRLIAALVYVCYVTSPMAGILPSHHLRAAGLSVDARSPSFFGDTGASLKSSPPSVSVETVRIGLSYVVDRMLRDSANAFATKPALHAGVIDPIARMRSRSVERAARADGWLQWAESVPAASASLTRSRSTPESTLKLTKSLLGSRFVNNNLTAGSITNIGSTIIAGGGISNMVGTGTAGNVTNQDVNLNLIWSGTYNGSPVGGAITQDPTKTGAQAIIQAGSLNIQNLNNGGIIVANTATITGTSVNGISDPAVRTVIPDGRRDPYTPATGPGADPGNANTAPPPTGPCAGATLCVNGTPYTYVQGNTTDPDNPVPGHYIDGKGATVGNPLAANPNAAGTVNRNNPNLFVNVSGTASGSTLAHIDNVVHAAPTHIGAAGITGPPGSGTTSPRANVKLDATVLDPNDPDTLTTQGGVPAKPGNPGTPAASGINPPLVPFNKWEPGKGTIDTRPLIPVAPSGNLFVAGTLNLNGGTFTNTGFIHADTIVLDHVDLINAQRLAEVHNTTIQGKKLWTNIDGYGAQPGAFISAAHWQINNSTVDADGNPIDPGSIVCKGECTFDLDIPDVTKEQLSAFLGALKGVYGDNLTFQQLEEFLRYSKHDSRSWLEKHLGVILAILAVVVAVLCWGTCLPAISAFLAQAGLGTTILIEGAAFLVANGLTAALAGAVMAGLTALVTQLAQAAITGEWNLERILKAVLLAAVTAGLTAGALQVLDQVLQGASLLQPGQSLASFGLGADGKTVTNWGQYAVNAATRAVVQAGVTTLVNGGNGSGFENAFLSSFVNNLSPGVAGAIGDAFKLTNADGSTDWGAIGAKAVIHAAAGCALAAAKKEDCGAGAIGAGVGELSAEILGKGFEVTDPAAISAASRLTAIGVAAAADKGDSAALADFFADNAVQNNYLSHTQVNQLADKLRSCGNDQRCRDEAFALAYQQSAVNDIRLLTCKATNTCDAVLAEYRAGYEAMQGLVNSGMSTNDISRVLNMENTAQQIIRSGLQNKACVTQVCIDNANYLLGVGKGLSGFTPAMLLTSTGMAAYALTTSILENGLTDTAVKVAQGIADIPANIKAGLNSSDPAVRGEALVNALAIGAVGTAVAAKLVQVGAQTLLRSPISIQTIRSADELNAAWPASGNWVAPYAPGTQVIEATTTQATRYARFLDDAGNPVGAWMVPEASLVGKTPQQIQQMLAIEAAPTRVMIVEAPPGTQIQISYSGPQPNLPIPAIGGALQVQLIGEGWGKASSGIIFGIPRKL